MKATNVSLPSLAVTVLSAAIGFGCSAEADLDYEATMSDDADDLGEADDLDARCPSR